MPVPNRNRRSQLDHHIGGIVDIIEIIAAKPDQCVGSAAAEQRVGATSARAGEPGAEHVEPLGVGGVRIARSGCSPVCVGPVIDHR